MERRAAAAFILILGLGLATAAGAQTQSRDQRKCIDQVHKGFRKVARAQRGEIQKCVKDGARRKLGAGSLEDCTTADRKNKVGKARRQVPGAGAEARGKVRGRVREGVRQVHQAGAQGGRGHAAGER